MVRAKGLEPSHLAVPEPKSGASANSATPARADDDTRFTRQALQIALKEVAHHSLELCAINEKWHSVPWELCTTDDQ